MPTVDLYERAVAYLLSMPKTEKQMRQWYARKTTDQNLIEEHLARLKEYHLLDDAAYAQAFVEAKRNQMGVGMIKAKLRMNGVAPAIIESAVATIEPQNELAYRLAEKYLRHKERTPEVKAKLLRWLLGRGLDYDLCMEVIHETWH